MCDVADLKAEIARLTTEASAAQHAASAAAFMGASTTRHIKRRDEALNRLRAAISDLAALEQPTLSKQAGDA